MTSGGDPEMSPGPYTGPIDAIVTPPAGYLEIESKWYVLHTKSRQEKLVAAALDTAGITHFLPLVKRVSYYGRHKALLRVPLFPSYVFLWGTLDDAYVIDRTKRIAKIIRVSDQKRLEWEIRNIRMALERDAQLEPCPYLKEGVRVEVRAGPFKGLQGWVHRKKTENRLVLQVEAFARGASLEIEASLLEVIE